MMRAIVGPGLLALGYAKLGGDRGALPGLAAMIGGALITESAITRVCPVNALLGLDTRPQRQRIRDLEAQAGRTTWAPPAPATVRH